MEINLLIKEHETLGTMDPESTDYAALRSTLQNETVKERYVFYLDKFSKPEYLKSIYKKFENKIERAEKLIQHEYPNVKLDKSFFEFNRTEIRKDLGALRKSAVVVNPNNAKYTPLAENMIFTDIALKSNVEKYRQDGSVRMSFRNYHSHAVEIVGYSTKENKKVMIPVDPIQLEAYGSNEVIFADFPVKPRRLHYKAANCGEQIFKCNPEEWARAIVTPEFEKFVGFHVVDERNEVRFQGKVVLNRSLVIDNCERFVIEPGTEIVLENGAYLLSYAPIIAKGTKDAPIRIYSEDENAQGVVCLSSDKSELNHVFFEGLGTIKDRNWTLTGSVTFYGAEVVLNNCSFKNNHCEDALNTIRCHVEMDNCIVDQTFSDGFDADFCTGTVKNSTFSNTGNDCIDFSGSVITISNCTIKNSGDKGISGGENSKLVVNNCTVDNAHIAIASKDKSLLVIHNVNILKANYAFAAYRKKPEYGPAQLMVSSVKTNNSSELHLLEKGSKLSYLKEDFVGTKKFDIDALYEQFNK